MQQQQQLLFLFVVVLFAVGAFAPFPSSDPRSIFNPVIEPWWCRAPRGLRWADEWKICQVLSGGKCPDIF